jgi:hypothetical protein
LRRSRRLRLRVLPLLLAATACTQKPLPDAGSPGAIAYVQQCGVCHALHQPGVMTAEMWKIQVARMAEMRARRGLAPLGAAQEKLILDYLTSHAG